MKGVRAISMTSARRKGDRLKSAMPVQFVRGTTTAYGYRSWSPLPILASYGFGLRTRLLGYFVRADWAWGVDDGVTLPRVFHFSLSLDI